MPKPKDFKFKNVVDTDSEPNHILSRAVAWVDPADQYLLVQLYLHGTLKWLKFSYFFLFHRLAISTQHSTATCLLEQCAMM